jgi:predicted aspartyl protease
MGNAPESASVHKFYVKGLTADYPRIVREIVTPLRIGTAYAPGEEPTLFPRQYDAVWDTGATHSVIRRSLAAELSLPALREATITGVGGNFRSKVYLASLHLPNDTPIPEIELLGCDDSLNSHMLIGMDIISQGDFLISTYGGTTVFSFQIPSYPGNLTLQGIQSYIGHDNGLYTNESFMDKKRATLAGRVGRNAPCSCGSGKKYKKCCGAAR